MSKEEEKTCGRCGGSGTHECPGCNGSGVRKSADGQFEKGISSCAACNGRGVVTCRNCGGSSKK